MAVQLHGRGQLPHGGPPKAAAHHRRPVGRRRCAVGSRSGGRSGAVRRRSAAPGGTRARQGAQQALPRRAMQLVVPPPRAPAPSRLAALLGVRLHLAVRVRHRRRGGVPRQEACEGFQEEGSTGARGAERRGGGRGGEEVHALRDGQDAAVEDGAHGAQDALQRVRRSVQVRPPRAGVPPGGEPDLRGVEALQLPPQGAGAAPPEGDAGPAPPPPPPASAAASAAGARQRRRRPHPRAEPAAVRRAVSGAAHRRRLLDPQSHRAGLPSAHLGRTSLLALEMIQLAQE
uniref:Uncharacterized protein n=1 Tax=Arundo donax TaxID=35708 RepID=A0A0A9EWN1_ARUDO